MLFVARKGVSFSPTLHFKVRDNVLAGCMCGFLAKAMTDLLNAS